MTRRVRTMVVLAMGVGLLTGCVDRRLSITSDPSGAHVYLNDQDVGVTPCEVNFTWYGTYDVRLRKDGYEPLSTTREAKAPLSELPPFDLVALAVPGTKKVRLDWHFELQPADNDTSGLLQRADELRGRVQSEEASAPLTPGEGEPDVTPVQAPELEPAIEPVVAPEAAPEVAPEAEPARPSAGPDYIEVKPTTTPAPSASPN